MAAQRPPRTTAQASASRRNGSLSAGPVTAGGKAKVSANGVVHGLRSERVVLAHEDPAAYVEHVQRWAESLKPSDEAELEVVVSIADLRWRLQRLDQVELNRTRAEVLAQLDDLPDKVFLNMVENTAQAAATMAEVLVQPRVRDDDDLQALLGAVRTVVDMVRAVEAERPRLFLGADQLGEAVALAVVLSAKELDTKVFADLAARARAVADAVAAQLPPARHAAEEARRALAATVPLPDARQASLWARYRRDIERRLQAEMGFLSLVRDRKAQVAATSGSVGRPVPVSIRLVG